MYKIHKINDKALIDRVLDSYEFTQKQLDEIKNGPDELYYCQSKDLDDLMYRLLLCKFNKEKVFIFGDYDADGICATSILVNTFRAIGIECNYYLPSRVEDGYGLSTKIVERAINYGFDLLICIDNGVKAAEAIEYAKGKIDLMIVDHHEYEQRPDVKWFLHPAILPEEFADSCAGGLALLIANRLKEDDYNIVLAGLASISDMVSVFGNNRIIVKKAYELYKANQYLNLKLLVEKEPDNVNQLFGYQIAPKINAISRMEKYNVNKLVAYLLSKDEEEIKATARELIEINKMRRLETTVKLETALKKVGKEDIIIVYDESFKEGLCGLIAARLMETYHRSCIVLSLKGNVLKGSGRAVEGFNLYEYLSAFEHFISFGGHDLAIGLSLALEDLDKLKDYIANHQVIIKEVETTAIEITSEEITLENALLLSKLRPFGGSFADPLFYLSAPPVKSFYRIKGMYPKWTLENDAEALSFRFNSNSAHPSSLIGRINTSNYQNKPKVVFDVIDIDK